MTLQQLEAYLIAKKGAYLDFPFDEETKVYKVCNKMFALPGEGAHVTVSLKCDPNNAIFLRDLHKAITPGYHFNKKHWNTLTLDGSLPDGLVMELIDHSYELVVKKLPKIVREAHGL